MGGWYRSADGCTHEHRSGYSSINQKTKKHAGIALSVQLLYDMYISTSMLYVWKRNQQTTHVSDAAPATGCISPHRCASYLCPGGVADGVDKRTHLSGDWSEPKGERRLNIRYSRCTTYPTSRATPRTHGITEREMIAVCRRKQRGGEGEKERNRLPNRPRPTGDVVCCSATTTYNNDAVLTARTMGASMTLFR